MNVTYQITEERIASESGHRISYGIAAYADKQVDLPAANLLSFCDITPDRDTLRSLVERCNRLKLSVIHLRDVIDDFLAD